MTNRKYFFYLSNRFIINGVFVLVMGFRLAQNPNIEHRETNSQSFGNRSTAHTRLFTKRPKRSTQTLSGLCGEDVGGV